MTIVEKIIVQRNLLLYIRAYISTAYLTNIIGNRYDQQRSRTKEKV